MLENALYNASAEAGLLKAVLDCFENAGKRSVCSGCRVIKYKLVPSQFNWLKKSHTNCMLFLLLFVYIMITKWKQSSLSRNGKWVKLVTIMLIILF